MGGFVGVSETFNAADPAQVKKRQRTEKDRVDQQREDLKVLLKMPEFRRYLWRHINESCGLFRSAANGNGSIQSQNIGMQDVARILWVEIEGVDPMAIPAMMFEWHEAQK
jgi:hypothetical protein